MLLDPPTGNLFTDEGEHIKMLRCPRGMKWESLAATPNPALRDCTACARAVLDTDGLSDAEVLALVRRDPHACLKVGVRQENVRTIVRDKEATAWSAPSRPQP